MSDRSREFDEVPRLWQGGTCFILGGGPSLPLAALHRLRPRQAIAVNSAGKIAPYADVLFFTDNGFFERERPLIDTWPGVAITLSRAAKGTAPERLLRIRSEPGPALSSDPGWVIAGRTSGHTAVNLARLLGADRAVLLGFDCRMVDGRSHFHNDLAEGSDDLYRGDFLPAWQGYGAAAAAIGLQVFNATPGSAIREFPFIDPDEVLPPC